MFPFGGGFQDPFGGGSKGFNDFGARGGPNFRGVKRPTNPLGPFGPGGNDDEFNIDMYAPPDMMGPDGGIGFPNTPDFNPQLRPGAQNRRMDPPQAQRPGLGNFAPPGTIPQIGSGTSPNMGIDGSGGILMKQPPQKPNMPVKGDFEQMQKMGLIEPPMDQPDIPDPNQDHHFDRNMYI